MLLLVTDGVQTEEKRLERRKCSSRSRRTTLLRCFFSYLALISQWVFFAHRSLSPAHDHEVTSSLEEVKCVDQGGGMWAWAGFYSGSQAAVGSI